MPSIGQGSLGLPRGKVKSKFQASESQIETSICHYLRIKGYFFWKQPQAGYFAGKQKDGHWIGSFRRHVNPYCRRGVPDLILVKNGQFIGLEVKTPTNRQTLEQVDFQYDLEKNGGKYFVVRSIEDVEKVLQEI